MTAWLCKPAGRVRSLYPAPSKRYTRIRGALKEQFWRETARAIEPITYKGSVDVVITARNGQSVWRRLTTDAGEVLPVRSGDQGMPTS